MRVRATLEHMIAVTYGVTYDAVVTRFGPYEAMIAEIVGLVGRSVPATDNPRAIKVLDIACGIGNVGLRLARAGYSVVAIDAVPLYTGDGLLKLTVVLHDQLDQPLARESL